MENQGIANNIERNLRIQIAFCHGREKRNERLQNYAR